MSPISSDPPGANITFDRTAGSHPLAAAGQRERWASQRRLGNGD